MLTNNLEQLKKASREGYAIPAINTQGGNYDIIMGICKAAEELRSPVILAHYVSTGAFSGHDWFVNVAKWCANKVSVPVSIHLDHGDGFPICMEALRLGFTSVMIDGSRLSLEDNIRLTLKAKELAAARGATLEAEIGRVGGDEGMGQVRDSCTRPEEALAFWRQTGVDALAVAIGNAHGNYRFAPELQFDILETIHNTVDCPLVLHGGTGISFADFRRTIDLGVRKINIATALLDAQREAARESLRGGADPSYFAVSEHMTERIAQTVARHIGVFNNREPLSAIE